MAKKATRGRTEYAVSPERFIRTWQQSSSVAEVAETLGMPKPIVLARKSNYTKLGIQLKKMPRQSPDRSLDVEGLNALIEEINRSGENPTGKPGAPSQAPRPGQDDPKKIRAGLDGEKKKGG